MSPDLLQTAVTASGRHLLKTWLLRPLTNLGDLQARHNMVHAFSSPENSQMSVRLLKLLKKIKNIPLHVKRIRRGRGGRREWIALVDVSVVKPSSRHG
jgi:DNA mismatch repair protein MSH5